MKRAELKIHLSAKKQFILGIKMDYSGLSYVQARADSYTRGEVPSFSSRGHV